MHLSPRKLGPRKVVLHTPDDHHSSVSYNTLHSSTSTASSSSSLFNTSGSITSPLPHTSFHTPSEPSSSSSRRPFALTPIPYPSDDDVTLRLPLSALSSGSNDDDDDPLVLITHHDEEEDGREGRASPEPSTASLSPSPVAHAWPESSKSGEGTKDEEEEERSEDEQDDVMQMGDGARFFSVMVAEESDEDDDTGSVLSA
jgi:hypothetical protein